MYREARMFRCKFAETLLALLLASTILPVVVIPAFCTLPATLKTANLFSQQQVGGPVLCALQVLRIGIAI